MKGYKRWKPVGSSLYWKLRFGCILSTLHRKELRIGYNSEFFQLYPFLTVTDDIADAMIYASRMKTGTDIILIFAPQIYHTCKASISYGFGVYHISQRYIIDIYVILCYLPLSAAYWVLHKKLRFKICKKMLVFWFSAWPFGSVLL